MGKKRLQMQRRSTTELEAARNQTAKHQPPPAGFDYDGLPRNIINQYSCWTCGGSITTVDIHAGVTPAMLACRATEGCEGMMHSHRYQVDQTLTPTHEWYKPTGKIKDRAMREYIEMGGLSIRPVQS